VAVQVSIEVHVLLGVLAAVAWCVRRRTSPWVYLLDFACYKPPLSLRCSVAKIVWTLENYVAVKKFAFPLRVG